MLVSVSAFVTVWAITFEVVDTKNSFLIPTNTYRHINTHIHTTNKLPIYMYRLKKGNL